MTLKISRPYSDPSMQRILEWTAKTLDASVATAKLIGCSPAAVTAQAAQETGWGKAAIGNNLFGIKADASWKGLKQLRRTWESENGQVVYIDAWFRDYPTLDAGILDHFEFLKTNSRYAKVFDPDDSLSDEDYFARLAQAGYATDPKYAENLCAVLDSVNAFRERMTDDDKPVVIQPRTLLVGTNGSDVANLQRILNIETDGAFGPATRDCVMRYQAAHGLEADGIVGPATRASLKL